MLPRKSELVGETEQSRGQGAEARTGTSTPGTTGTRGASRMMGTLLGSRAYCFARSGLPASLPLVRSSASLLPLSCEGCVQQNRPRYSKNQHSGIRIISVPCFHAQEAADKGHIAPPQHCCMRTSATLQGPGAAQMYALPWRKLRATEMAT